MGIYWYTSKFGLIILRTIEIRHQCNCSIPVVDTTKEAAEIESCPVVVVVVLLLVVVVGLFVVVVVFALMVVVFALVVVVFALDFLGCLPNIEKSILGLI